MDSNSDENKKPETIESTPDVQPVSPEEPISPPSETSEVSKNTESPKKTSLVLSLAIILAALIIGGGAFWFIYSNRPEEITHKKENTTIGEISTDPFLTADDLPRIDASLATQPLVDAILKDFTGKTREELGIEYTNTDPAYEKLINGETDLIVVSEPSEEELSKAADAGIDFELTKITSDGFVFFVNKDNPVDNVSFEDIKKIYTGEITNWKDLGGNDAEIIAYQRPANSGSQTGLLNLVLQGEEPKIPTVTENVALSMVGIIDYVANYDNSINAIGYSYYYYANVMYKNDKLKFLAIDDIHPNYSTIRNEEYPIMTAGYIVTRKGDANEKVHNLIENMLSLRGQKVISELGYIPARQE